MMRKQVKRKKYSMMVFGALAIFFTGYPHIWSVYSPYVMDITGWTAGQTSMCFYLTLLFFVIGNIVGGRIQDKSNPIKVLSIGGFIQAAGVFGSAFLLNSNPLPMYLAFGVLQGFGQGMIYTVILATAQKWFPDKKGFATGVVSTANGLCGFFLAPLSERILVGYGPKNALMVIGVLMAVAWILSSIFVKVPEGSQQVQSAEVEPDYKMLSEQYQYSAKEMIKSRKFYLLVATMMCGLISYFLVSPNARTLQLERGVAPSIAVTAVMVGSVMNAGTRLILPTLADRVGRSLCIKMVMVVSFLTMTSLVFSQSYITTIGVIIMYGCYGGIMGSFPSFTSSIFGTAHSGENYGYVMSGVVIATLGAPAITSGILGVGKGMELVFGIGAGCALFGLVTIIILDKELGNKRVKQNTILETEV